MRRKGRLRVRRKECLNRQFGERDVDRAPNTVVVVNVARVAGSVVLLVSGWVAPTVLGYAFVLVQAAAVAILAELQWIGLRRTAVQAA